jgi:hypothetical protein
MSEPPYYLIASHDFGNDRSELRRYADRYEAVRLRPRVGGGWYVRDSIEVWMGVSATTEQVSDDF